MKLAAVLSTALMVSACHNERVIFTPLPVPEDKTDTEFPKTSDRPLLPTEHVIDWSQVQTVEQAKAQHDLFVVRLREREGLLVTYIVDLEGRVFEAASDDLWIREWQDGIIEE